MSFTDNNEFDENNYNSIIEAFYRCGNIELGYFYF